MLIRYKTKTMKLKKLLPYILIFLASFFLTPVLFNKIIKRANKNASEFVQNFYPQTNHLPNGIYSGKYKIIGLFTLAKIEFEINNGNVIDINLKKLFHSPGSPYKDEIEKQILRSKKLEVNAISGATRTSNFAKAAIKVAIEDGNKQ